MMTRPFINTYGVQHFKQYVYRGIEQYKREMYLNHGTKLQVMQTKKLGYFKTLHNSRLFISYQRMRKIEGIMATFIEQGMQSKCSVTKKIGHELNKSRC